MIRWVLASTAVLLVAIAVSGVLEVQAIAARAAIWRPVTGMATCAGPAVPAWPRMESGT